MRTVVIWKREASATRWVLAWLLEGNTDLGGGMNGRLKTLSFVAVCQCQLGGEWARNPWWRDLPADVPKYSQNLGSHPHSDEKPTFEDSNAKVFLTQLVKALLFLPLNWSTRLMKYLLCILFYGKYLKGHREKLRYDSVFPECPSCFELALTSKKQRTTED